MSNQETASFWEHVSELRQTLIKILALTIVGMGISLFFYQEIFSLLAYPLNQNESAALEQQEIQHLRITNSSAIEQSYTLPSSILNNSVSISSDVKEHSSGNYQIPPGGYIEYEKVNQNHKLVVLGPLDGMLASLKLSFWIGIVGTSPIWLFFLLEFLAPALKPKEKRLIIPFVIISLIFLSLGFSFAYFLTIPFANHYLQLFNQTIGENLWSLSTYMDYTISLLLANALAFECCVILLFLVHLGVFTARSMRKKRKHAIVLAFILGAVLTPPDIFTQFLLAVPLIGFYELIILYAKLREAKDNLLYANMN
jgi:sec-independent protein translocase protein TatC